MSRRPAFFILLAVPCLGLLAACQPPPPPVPARGAAAAGGPGSDAAVLAHCRQRADEIYAAQNRSARLVQENRDSPFSGTYSPGISSRNLADRFEYDRMISDCMRANGTEGPGPDPAQAPLVQARPASRLPSGPAEGPPVNRAASPQAAPLDRAPPPPHP